MNRNPIIPFLLIIFLGIGLVFLLSSYGANDSGEDDTASDEGTEQADNGDDSDSDDGDDSSSDDADAEGIAQDSCASCHGDDFSGGMGPALAGTDLDEDTFYDDVRDGIEGTSMPAHSEDELSDDDIAALYDYFSEQ